MCTLLLWKHQHPRYPLIAAANRDEFLRRPSTPPCVLSADPLVVGGRDLTREGSWFAVTERGLVVALTNRRGAGSHDPAKRSRGQLVLDVARSASIDEAADRVRRIDAAGYNPFILLVADARDALVVHAGVDGTGVKSIGDGAHAITNWDLDADSPAKAARAKRAARAFSMNEREEADGIAARLHALLADHGSETGDAPLCVHRPEESYGTRSSSLAFFDDETRRVRMYHVEGAPCTGTLADASPLLLRDREATSQATTGRLRH